MSVSLKPLYLINAGISGGLFGAGLYVSQMVDPLKVLRFLDFGAMASGGWDPSLAFVIVAAIGVMFVGLRIAGKRARPLLDTQFYKPESKQVDLPLVAGAVLFGIGWGMSGICPGPAITLVAFMPQNLAIFLMTMFAGSLLGSYIKPLLQQRAPLPDGTAKI
ncbi:DUF6691 family protein [Mariluticola halotolerans]|uniref:DUF6691 family protein n=1 Tax=Mariluticola halotolerans TaxID=2909283 RepID=UPI0026E1A9F1|nr:DUF6691 family protein [Mariluticola halotolerans]UJQ95029.1 YeeE/YedE family protein [Mariluticola halotolerans]